MWVLSLAQIDQIILQSANKVFDKLPPEDKTEFYNLLRKKYNFDFSHFSQNYDVFHSALKEAFPLKHYKIEAEIIGVMHKDTKNGIYILTDEAEAFTLMIKIIQEDEENTIKTITNRLDDIDRKRQIIQQRLDNEKTRIERLDNYLEEIHSNIKQREGKGF